MLIDSKSLESIVSISKDLLEVDITNTKILKYLNQCQNSVHESVIQLSSLLREDLERLKSNYIYFNQTIENSFKKVSSSLCLLENKNDSVHSPFTNTISSSIKQVLLRVLPPEIIEAKKAQSSCKIKESLQEYLKLRPLETILITQNTDQRLKILSDQYKSVLHYIECIAEELLCFYKSNTCNIPRTSFIKDTRFFAEEPSKTIDKVPLDTSKKKLQSTITSLLNRGSLTDCEAKKLLKRVNKPPAIVVNSGCSIVNMVNGTNGSDDSPLTETLIISGESSRNLEKKIRKSLQNSKLTQNTSKRGFKSLSSLAKKRNSNSSLHKPLSISVKYRNSSSSTKFKSKSPNSFTHDKP